MTYVGHCVDSVQCWVEYLSLIYLLTLVKSSLERVRRKLARPVQPKEPLSVDTVCRIADIYISSRYISLGFTVWTKFETCLLKMSPFTVNTCQFSFRNARIV